MAKSYDLKSGVQCIVAGVLVSGFGENDAVTVERMADQRESMPSADGDVVYSKTNDNRVRITLTLHDRSRAYRDLAAAAQAQLASPVIVPTPFFLSDTNGDSITSAEAIFMRLPEPSKNRRAGEVQFLLELPNPNITHGILIAL